MEKPVSSNPDCECGPDCCAPKQKPKWIKYISILIVLVALAIVVIKLTGNHQPPASNCCPAESVGFVQFGDTVSKSSCDTTKTSSCCPKAGN